MCRVGLLLPWRIGIAAPEGAYSIERWPEERALGPRGPPTEACWLMLTRREKS